MDHSILPAAYVGGGFPYGFTRWLRIYVYRILRCFSDKTYLLFLSLLPVLYLVKMSIHGGVFGGRDGWRGFDAF